MKKIIAAICFISIFLIAGYISGKAQTFEDFRKLPVEQKAQLITDSLKAGLNLTDDQYSKVYAAILEGAKKAMTIMHSSNGRVSKGKQLKELLAEREAEIKPVLSDNQFALYQSKKKKAIAYYRKYWQEQKVVFNTPG